MRYDFNCTYFETTIFVRYKIFEKIYICCKSRCAEKNSKCISYFAMVECVYARSNVYMRAY